MKICLCQICRNNILMYEIEFYETEDGKCPIWDFLEALRLKAPTNKDARIQHKQASLYIELLQQNGTHMNAEITKHLDDGIDCCCNLYTGLLLCNEEIEVGIKTLTTTITAVTSTVCSSRRRCRLMSVP